MRKFLLLLLFVLGCGGNTTPTPVPPGFEIVTNGKNFRFRFPEGDLCVLSYTTRDSAAEGAWELVKARERNREREEDEWVVAK